MVGAAPSILEQMHLDGWIVRLHVTEKGDATVENGPIHFFVVLGDMQNNGL